MDGFSKTDEVLALLNKHERGDVSAPVQSQPEEALAFKDYLPSPAAAILHSLQRVSLQRQADATPAAPVRSPEEALKVVLGEQRQDESRTLRRSTASFRKKLFGHAMHEDYEEDIISHDSSADIVRVHPLSHFKRYWDMAIVCMVAYTVVVLPVRCAFSWDYYHQLDAGHNLFHQLAVDWTLATDLLIDLFFMSDILLNFNTGYITDQKLVMGRRRVARNYLQGWFALDLVSSFPIDLLLFGKRSDLWRLPRLLKVIRVLHNKTLAKAAHDVKRLKIFANISQFDSQILKLLAYVFLWIHWNSCLQYGSCVAQPDSSMCWVMYNHLQGATLFEKYSWSALKAMSEMVTAGYGVQNPETMIDVWVTMFSLLTGTTMWLILGSIITTLLIHLNAAHSEYTAKMTALSQYMIENNLPQELRQRIRDSYEARWKAEKHFDEDQILNEMPGSLRIEVCMHTCADLITSVPFLEDAEDDFVRYLVTQLHPTVYLRNDMIIRVGELGREMYFIKSGVVQVELEGSPVTVLKRGSYFGELALLRDMRRTASVRCISETCDLFVLTKEDFVEVTHDYPDAWHSMDLVAEHRLRMLRTSNAYARWQAMQKSQPNTSSKLSIKIEQVLEAQDLADGRDSGDESKLGVPTPMSDRLSSSQQHHQMPGLPPKPKPLWAAPMPRRQPISLGLSLKQQVSSPRWGARGLGNSFRPGGALASAQYLRAMNAMNTYTRPASSLGIPPKPRRALTSDEVDTGHGHSPNHGQRYSEQSAESIGRPSDLGQPFIELSSLESDGLPREGDHTLHRAASEASLRIESPVWVADADSSPHSPQHVLSQQRSPQPSPLQHRSVSQPEISLQQGLELGDEDEYGQWERTTGPDDEFDDPHTHLL